MLDVRVRVRVDAEGAQVLREAMSGQVPQEERRARAAEDGAQHSTEGAEVLEVQAKVSELGGRESNVCGLPAESGSRVRERLKEPKKMMMGWARLTLDTRHIITIFANHGSGAVKAT